MTHRADSSIGKSILFGAGIGLFWIWYSTEIPTTRDSLSPIAHNSTFEVREKIPKALLKKHPLEPQTRKAATELPPQEVMRAAWNERVSQTKDLCRMGQEQVNSHLLHTCRELQTEFISYLRFKDAYGSPKSIGSESLPGSSIIKGLFVWIDLHEYSALTEESDAVSQRRLSDLAQQSLEIIFQSLRDWQPQTLKEERFRQSLAKRALDRISGLDPELTKSRASEIGEFKLNWQPSSTGEII
ncbi:MAG: hypothetical protein RJB38_455 [Pseudomonadota bacterium]